MRYNVQVIERVQAAHGVVTFWLAVPGTTQSPAQYLPGQFITIGLPTARGPIYRSYSLCGPGSGKGPWEITIKRHHAGVVSRYLYDSIRPGMLLQASAPAGSFTLPRDLNPQTSLILVALGSGITPIYGMLRAIARRAPTERPRVQLHYAYHSPTDSIYAREINALDPQHSWLAQCHYVSTQGARITPDLVWRQSGAPARAEWYVCGPVAFKRNMEGALARYGVPAKRFHAEIFTTMRAASSSAASAAMGRGRVRLADRNAVLETRPGETLLEALERNGYHPQFSCRVGSCGTCKLRRVSGQVREVAEIDPSVLTPSERAQGYVLSCVSQPVGEVTLASILPASAAFAGSAQLSGARRATRTVMRWSLAGAAVAVFSGAWGLTSYTPSHQTAGGVTTAPTVTPCVSDGDDNTCAITSPNGPSGITTQPTQPVTPPNTRTKSS
jgi:ferredoxin-NADP reductase